MPEPVTQVRPAVASDVEDIARLHICAWQRAYRGQVPDHVLDALDEQQRAARCLAALAEPATVLLVALQAGRVVGFCSLMPSRDPDGSLEVGEVVALYVHPDRWRCGAGRALIHEVLTVASGRGHRVLTLWVLESNAPARSFYEAVGFVADGKSKVEQRADYALAEVRYRRGL